MVPGLSLDPTPSIWNPPGIQGGAEWPQRAGWEQLGTETWNILKGSTGQCVTAGRIPVLVWNNQNPFLFEIFCVFQGATFFLVKSRRFSGGCHDPGVDFCRDFIPLLFTTRPKSSTSSYYLWLNIAADSFPSLLPPTRIA